MKVSLIGAGPGDPGLFTLRGKELLAEADCIVYDALANAALLEYARPDAELIYVGKIADKHALPQPEINELLAKKAQAGLNVARLKGGDPYIFGRGGEEGEYLAERSIPFEEVPGITSAIAAPAYAGIPLTHRDFVSSVTIITGHEKPGKEQSAHNWRAYVESGATLVFVMGMKNLPHIMKELLAAGMDPQMPAAIIYRGTTAMQRSLVGQVENIAETAAAAGFTNPAVIVAGKVAALAPKLDWFSRKPLLGRTIVVTRAREQASDIAASLAALGAHVLECPSIAIEPLADYAACDAAIYGLDSYAWLVFTSVNGVKYFWRRLEHAGKDSRSLHAAKIAAIGPATAKALEQRGIKADIVPKSYVAESVAQAIREHCGAELSGQHILLPRAAKARNALPDDLAAAGAVVDIVPVYEAKPAHNLAKDVLAAMDAGALDCVTFGSSSTVENFLEMAPAALLQKHPEVTLAAIGPITGATLRKHGLTPAIQPENFTIPGMIAAIVEYYNGGEK